MEEIQNDAAKDYQTEFKQALEYYKGQNFDQGEAICRKLIDEFPDKVRCHYLLGHILMEVQRFQESVEQFLETVKKDVDEKICGDAYYWIGVIYGTSGWPEIGNAAYIYDSEKSKEYFRLAVDCRSYPAEALLQFKYEAKGQERIDLMEKGIKAFPERPEFYLLLSEHYGQHELFQLQLSALERAEQNGIQSLSLSYRLGCYYFKLQEFEQALLYFEKALSDLSGRGNYFPIKYYLGRIAEAFGDYDGAEAYYLQICAEQSADQDILFGVFGLITTYMLSDQKDKLYDFIQNLNLTKELFQVDGRIVGGPVFLIEHVVDDIGADNLDEVQEALSKLKPNRSSAILNGKIWLLQSCIAGLNSDYNEQYKAMRNALKSLPLYHYPFVADLYADSVLNLLSYEFKTKTDKDRFYQFLKADFDEKPALAESLAPYVHDIFDPFFSPSGYEKLISLSQYFNKKQLAEHDGLFRVAHSYAELNNNLKSEEYYSYYLEQCGDNTSVLNNLGNILDDKGDYAGAIALYERGLAIDPKHTNLNQNILISRKNWQQPNKRQ
ncbi:tetratricopeptide repeat protein [Mucilaginibacter sp. P25]|uniref:tetratricopeptide repeat protein n=1 Tax=Mucilaginibacter sp. P25 TaxID=3423945 RepID=UPI003D790E3C